MRKPRKHRKLPACCANCFYSDRRTIYNGWIKCLFRPSKKVRFFSRPCLAYLNEDILLLQN